METLADMLTAGRLSPAPTSPGRLPPAVMEHATWTTAGGYAHVEIQAPQLAPIRADFVMTDAGLALDAYGWRVHEFCAATRPAAAPVLGAG